MLNVLPTMSALVSEFCQWLLQNNTPNARLGCIVLHSEAGLAVPTLVEEISRYLNEYDDEAGGCWLGVSSGLLEAIGTDPHLTQWMDLGGCCGCSRGCCSQADQSDEQKWASILKALGKRGRLVFHAPTVTPYLPAQARAFHVGIGRRNEIASRCHITLDPEMIETGRLPQIVADVYLEWSLSQEVPPPLALKK